MSLRALRRFDRSCVNGGRGWRAQRRVRETTRCLSAPGSSASIHPGICSVRQRIGTNLDMYRHWRHALAALLEPGRAIAFRGPQTPAFPARLRVVDACVQSLGVEAHGIRDTQHDHLAVDQRDEAVIFVAGGNRHILAETDRIVLVDPRVVTRLRTVITDASKTWPGVFVELPALRALIASRLRPVEGAFALTAVKAANMTAGQ